MTERAPVLLCGSTPTPRLRRLAAIFGLEARRGERRGELGAWRRCARRVERQAQSGGITLIGGASGAGKSTLLREIAGHAERGGKVVRVDHLRPARADTPLADRHDGDGLLDALASAGLAEARLLARTPNELSEGQRARLGLADAAIKAADAGVGVTIVADEFASALDRVTARSVSVTWARWVRRSGARAFVATAHDDLAEWLDPELRVHLRPDGTPRIEERGAT